MCGIAGSFGSPDPAAAMRVRQMLAAQSHRGPDGAGIAWCGQGQSWELQIAASPQSLSVPNDVNSSYVLGHNLLAIQDLSAAAGQPMLDGDLALVFNGEIYNFVELRKQLESEGVQFRTAGDTEVLLEMWKRHGPDCLALLRGMFAFAVFDSRRRVLHIVRDPLGIKPLYYTTAEGRILFASEIRALHAAGIPRKLCPEAAVASAAAGINAFGVGRTLYQDIHELPPGHLLTATEVGIQLQPHTTLPELVADLRGPEATLALREATTGSVRLHLRSRRRIATCLSGGLDSSTIACLIGQLLPEARRDFQTFTICTAGTHDSELELAAMVARASGLRHELVTPSDIPAADVLEMTVAYEVPNHVIGPINQFILLRQIAASGVTVVLDGQGGDELLSGYPWYAPVLLKEIARRGQDAMALETKLREKSPLEPATMQAFEQMFHDPIAWVNAFIWQGNFLGWSPERVRELPATQYYLDGGGDWRTFRQRQYLRAELQYLLRQEDRLGMWLGLECRVPFVDLSLIGVASRLAPDWLIHDGYLKYPLRVMLDQLPDAVRWNTRKRGFWETDRARFPWVAEMGRKLAADSICLREVFPTVVEGWDGLSFDQHWRLLQLALLERCGDRSALQDVRRELRV